MNEHVGYLYHPLHPAILRMVRYVVDAGHAAGMRVGMCGEMAGEPMFALMLLGLGLDELSMNSTAIPVVKSVLRGATLAAAKALAEQALSLATGAGDRGAGAGDDVEVAIPEELLKAAGEMLPPESRLW